MRCTQCGLPLSPKRNNCPRCGTPVNTSNPAKAEFPPHPTSAPAPQMPFEVGQGMPPSESTQQVAFPTSGPTSQPVSNITNNLADRPGQPLAHKPYLSTQDPSKTIRIGLTSAGLCIIVGSLLLAFVYLVGQGVSPAGETTTPNNTHTTLRVDQTATATHHITPTPPPLTPTPTLPGQGLLDTSVLASVFNEQTGQIIQQATSFQIYQKIYVVLSLHSGSNSHAICLNWYLNDQSVNKFAFEANPISSYHYYSYTTMSTPGNGHVDVSLASTTACADAIMAKILNFTVNG